MPTRSPPNHRITTLTRNKVEESSDDKQATTISQAEVGWIGKIGERYYKTKAGAEAYPYVWGSYIVVYDGFGLWFAYRWRKLRRTEDRVRVLQDRLRKMVETEESSATSSDIKNNTNLFS